MAERTDSVADAARVVRFWQAVEIFSPQPLPKRDAGQHVEDYMPGKPMPWESGSRLGEQPIGLGQVWRHDVFGGVYPISRVRDVLVKRFGPDDQDGDQQPPARGQSALFACTLDSEGRPVEESAALSAAAWALGRLLAGGQIVGVATSSTWLNGLDHHAARPHRGHRGGARTAACGAEHARRGVQSHQSAQVARREDIPHNRHAAAQPDRLRDRGGLGEQ